MDSGAGCVRLGVVAILSTFIACGGSNGPSGPSPVPQIRGGETLFAEDFESGTLDAWQDGVNPTKQRVVTGQDAQAGDHYLAVTYPAGADGGWLTRFFMPGYQAMYVSFYVRFPGDWSGGWAKANRPKELEIKWSDNTTSTWTLTDDYRAQTFVPPAAKSTRSQRIRYSPVSSRVSKGALSRRLVTPAAAAVSPTALAPRRSS